MRKKYFSAIVGCIGFTSLFSNPVSEVPVRTVRIVGGGIIGALESYYAYRDSVDNGTDLRITVYEKGQSFEKPAVSSLSDDSTNTAFNIVPSLTIDEILSVVPRGSDLFKKLSILFSDPEGIRVDDVPGVNDSLSSLAFQQAVALYAQDPSHDDRTQTLLGLGRRSMDLWQELYDRGDEELKAIFRKSNYNPCRNPTDPAERALHDGYRIDLLYEIAGAKERARAMKNTYREFGYTDCELLSPEEVQSIDPSLTAFCAEHSEKDENGVLDWKEGRAALWRPGGCVDTTVFLPELYAYLQRKMGVFVNESGETEERFRLEFNKEVTGVDSAVGSDARITGLTFADGSSVCDEAAEYVFSPGESVGTLHRLGFLEPAYARFAGPSLFLNVTLPEEQDSFPDFSHCMEVHKPGVVLAWQAKKEGRNVFIGAAGTKAFYGDQSPSKEDAFAKNRHLVQLNMINDVLPDLVSTALGYPTKGVELSWDDLVVLEGKGMLRRWVGTRAVAYDGFPTLGTLYIDDVAVGNARCTTHLGSGGVSFGPAAASVSRSVKDGDVDELTEKVLRYGDSRRYPTDIVSLSSDLDLEAS